VTIDPSRTRQSAELKQPVPLLGARFDPSGKFVYAGGQDNAIIRWDIATGKKTALVGHASWVRAIAFSAKHQLAISGDYHGKLLFWPLNAAESKPLKSIDAHDGWLRACAVSVDQATLVTCGNDGLVKLWSLPDGKPLKSLPGHGCHVYNVAFRRDGLLASADLKGVVKLWDIAKGAVVRECDAKVLYKYDEGFRADIGGVRGMAFNPNGQWLACAGITEVSNAFAGVGKPLVMLFDATTGKLKHALKPKEAFQGTAWGVAIHPAGHVIATGGGNGGALWFWSLEMGENTFTLKLPVNARDLDMSADGTRLAIPFADGALRVYEMSAKTSPSWWQVQPAGK